MTLLHPRAVLVVALPALVVLALAAALVGAVGPDARLRDAILAAASPAVVRVVRVVNVMGDWRFLLPATLLLLALVDRARRAWWVWIALMIAAPLAEGVLKLTVGRARPENASYGFPSGHATAAAADVGAVLYLSEGLGAGRRALVRSLAVVALLLVGLARIVLRAHWPSDVLGGFALGLALASVAAVLAERAEGRASERA
jgi:undecaprenyl-diphosphatase